ncbi:recombinase family protein [Alsobacter sp. KACC 23698]|uniref:Recombinase family protein n=1 Tax=Alsobacter sp. KACC 23698 TaxID=3149229 RepID=A0AAU7JB32_9HYPH
MLGLKVEQTFVERGVSGSKPLIERAAGGELLAILRAGDVVITPKLDRMFRSANDALRNLEHLARLGVHLHMIDLGSDVTVNGIAKLVFTILSAVAEAERDRIRERVSTAKADQKSRKRYLGGSVPFGYSVAAGALIENPAEQEAIRAMAEAREAGKSLRAISADIALIGAIRLWIRHFVNMA